ncbi:hypothetical protein FH972_021938 [Carpinus fangiana]|uniref:DNA replication regulator Sld3 C-terminal domain-containing protein n=1 Tax=Carpinus fangiana TaxID=176857 RepID=A0A5N6KRC5_9ROSI|nr:hypothetical protein FH972_021938 [Carpinus fangiana]
MTASGALLEAPPMPDAVHTSPGFGASRKRRRNVGDDHASAGEPFCLYPHRDTLTPSKPLLARPQCLVARSRLPLAFLHPTIDLLPARLFRTLSFLSCNNTYGTGSHIETAVLVVVLEDLEGLFAVENVHDNVYSISKLSPWLSLANLEALPPRRPMQSIGRPFTYLTQISTTTAGWWDQLALLPQSFQNRPQTDRPFNATSTLLSGNAASSPSNGPGTATPASTEQPQAAQSDPASELPEAALTNVIMQYLNCLYVSKASHAYFAKAPLARARVAYQQIHGTQVLAGALREMILTTSCLDKKFRDTVPDMVKASSLAIPANEGTQLRRAAKEMKLKRPKPNKDGFYSTEKNYVSAWWIAEQEASGNDQTSLLQKSTQKLRFRETLLQIILILEVVSLEALPASTEVDAQLSTDIQDASVKKPRKRLQDLDMLLDLHIDRLCIYQSLQDIDVKDTDKVQKSIEADEDPSSHETDMGNAKETRDDLKDFCTAVAIPFYGAKLPKTVELLGRKAGVKVGNASSRKRSADRVVPGTEIKRRRPDQLRKSLQKVKTDKAGSIAGDRMPSLSRSATDSLLHGFDRPKSPTPQSATFIGDTRRSLSRANSVAQSVRGRTREVDMGAIHKFNESRQKKSANVEQELKDAIATLKKPNRGMAVKDYVDASDRRKASKLGSKSASQRLAPGVQIDATPKRATKTAPKLFTTPRRSALASSPDPTDTTARLHPLILNSVVRPASTMAPPKQADQRAISPIPLHDFMKDREGDDLDDSDVDGFVPQSAIKVPRADTDSETPFKRPARPLHYRSEVQTRLFGSPQISQSTKVNVAVTPTKSKPTVLAVPIPETTNVTVTPSKPKASAVLPAPEDGRTMPTPSVLKDGSIYASLGWDDDADDLL